MEKLMLTHAQSLLQVAMLFYSQAKLGLNFVDAYKQSLLTWREPDFYGFQDLPIFEQVQAFSALAKRSGQFKNVDATARNLSEEIYGVLAWELAGRRTLK